MLLFEVFLVALCQAEHGFCVCFRDEKGDRRCETENACQNVTCTASRTMPHKGAKRYTIYYDDFGRPKWSGLCDQLVQGENL